LVRNQTDSLNIPSITTVHLHPIKVAPPTITSLLTTLEKYDFPQGTRFSFRDGRKSERECQWVKEEEGSTRRSRRR